MLNSVIMYTFLKVPRSCSSIFGEDRFHPAHDSAYQTHFDAVRMRGRFCENILHDTFGQFSGTLILFLDNLDPRSRLNINSVSSIHLFLPTSCSSRMRLIFLRIP